LASFHKFLSVCYKINFNKKHLVMLHMNRLRELREDNDQRLDQVAAFFDVHPTTISKYELGQRALTADWVIKFCRYYDVTADYLLGLSSLPHAAVSNSDTELLHAYPSASLEIRRVVDAALAPYKEERQDATAAS